MEATCEAIRNCILTKMQPYLEAESDESDPLEVPDESAVVTGAVDLSRYIQKTVCAIVPESTSESDGNIADAEQEHTITVSFMHRGREYSLLVSRMFRYAEAFKSMLRDDNTLDGEALSVTIGNTQYYPDAGSIEKQMTAGEVEITVKTHSEVLTDDVFD